MATAPKKKTPAPAAAPVKAAAAAKPAKAAKTPPAAPVVEEPPVKAAKPAKTPKAPPAPPVVEEAATPPAKPARAKPTKAAAEPEAPPAPEPEPIPETLYDVIMRAAQSIDADFKAPHAKETEKTFCARLVTTMGTEGEEADAAYDALPEDAQAWVNAATIANNEAKPFPELPGFPAKASKAPAAPADGDAPKAERGAGLKKYREEQAKLKAEGKLPAKAPKVKAPKKPKEPKQPKGVNVNSITHKIREHFVANQKVTPLEVQKSMGEHVKLSSIYVVLQGAASMMVALRAAGMLKE